ncbi:MAG TPA: PRC-barrel domain-containing protein [Candidatus Tectomicrobia bacterium]|jgi:sporulation protein YlmC with PRC-barrel domain
MYMLRVSSGLAFLLIWVVTTLPASAAQDVSFPLYKMHTVLDQVVETPQGKNVGHIEEVVLEAATGHMAYVVLAFGGVLGLGDKLVALPWWALHVSAAARPFQLQLTEEQLKNAPGFTKDQWPDMEAKHWRDAIQAYYGRSPHEGQALPPETTRAAEEPVPQRFLRASYILQSKAVNPRGQRLGEIKDVVIDATAGRVVYAVLAFKGILQPIEKLFALPWQTLQQSAGLGTFTLDVDVKTLQEAPGFDNDRWPQQAQAPGLKGQ